MTNDLTVYAVYDYHDLIGLYMHEADADARRAELINTHVHRHARDADPATGPDPDLRWKLELGITVEPCQVHGTFTPDQHP